MSTMLATSPRVFSSTATRSSTSSRSTCSPSAKSVTLMTQMSLFSCFSICSRMRSSPRVTRVMRETVGSRVSATDRLSMLKPRPLNKPATRASTPNSFSTRTEMVCRMRRCAALPGGASTSVAPMAGEDLHDAILSGQLELLESLALDFLVRTQVHLVLITLELAFQVDVLVVVAPQVWLPFEQRLDEIDVLF